MQNLCIRIFHNLLSQQHGNSNSDKNNTNKPTETKLTEICLSNFCQMNQKSVYVS